MVHGTYNGFFQRVLELRCASQVNNAHGLDYLKAPVRKHNRVDFAVDFAVKVALLSAMDKSPNLVPVLLLGEGHGPADFETVDNIHIETVDNNTVALYAVTTSALVQTCRSV